MAGSTPLVSSAVVAAPKDYTVPEAQEILLQSVRASIDGSGTAAPYLPALQIIAPDGTVMCTAVPTTNVVAGASTDVSWFPGVSPQGSGLVLSGLMAARIQLSANQTIPAITNTIVNFDTLVFDTGTPTPFWNALHPTRLTAPVNGLYFVSPTLIWAVDANVTTEDIAMYLVKNSDAQALFKAAGLPAGSISFTPQGFHLQTWQLNAGDWFEVAAYHESAGNLDLQVIPAGGDHHDMHPTFTMTFIGPV
jgi:hypothetical protein